MNKSIGKEQYHSFLMSHAETLAKIFDVWLDAEKDKIFEVEQEQRDFQIEFCKFLEDKLKRFKTNIRLKEQKRKPKDVRPQV